jgi:CRP-like cAMP-binding protein
MGGRIGNALYSPTMPAEFDELDAFLSAALRAEIETRYYARVNEQARLERALQDPLFFQNCESHPALFPDHGVVHVRDVARQVISVLDAAEGMLIPAHPAERRQFLKSYGVLLAYLHDMGMSDFSPFGRTMHAEFAAQAPFAPELAGFVEAVWRGNCGGLAARLSRLAAEGALACPPEVVLRELLALAGCHRKSSIPVALLNAPARLRRRLQAILTTDLHILYEAGAAPENLPRTPDRLACLQPFYADFERQSFAWLEAKAGPLGELRDEAIDTLRALRAADALRQRGTVLKTSGGYEIMLDWTRGQAVYALRRSDEQLFLLSMDQPLAAGEANLAAAELTPEGDLRLAFQRGAFASPVATKHVARCMAAVLDDIQADVVGSFARPLDEAQALGLKAAEDMALLLENTDDSLDFGERVAAELRRTNPNLPNPVRTVPSLRQADPAERMRYLAAGPLAWDADRRRNTVARLGHAGHRIDSMDLEAAFEHVRLVRLQAGDILVEAGRPASFVYLPLGEGLTVMPLGGYAAFAVQPWMLLGVSGVIRGADRNATVVAGQEVELLVIPREVYLRQWHRTYTAADLRERLQNEHLEAGPV